ncbi:RNA polymerase sigma factor [bacterium]|nr:RNA polymerase sigma factor [bacterium]
MKKFSDKKIIISLKKGDVYSFSFVYDEFFDEIYRFIYFKVLNEDKASDFASDVFMKLVDYIRKEKGDIKNVRAMLYKIARNLIIDNSRKKREEYIEDIGTEISDSSNSSLDEVIADTQDVEKVKRAIANLPESYREVLIMKFIEELSNSEIAKVLEKKESAVRTLISRAISRLKGELGK